MVQDWRRTAFLQSRFGLEGMATVEAVNVTFNVLLLNL